VVEAEYLGFVQQHLKGSGGLRSRFAKFLT